MIKLIVLVGPPGSGKTTAGTRLAEELGWQFVDTDAVITEKCGTSIANLFATRGETYFRDLESETLALLLAEYGEDAKTGLVGLVIGTGGGLVVSKKNRKMLQPLPAVFYLTADLATLAERLSGDATRPLLQATADNNQRLPTGDEDASRRLKLESLLASRKEAYEEAKFKIDTSGRSIEEVVREILSLLQLSSRSR